MCMDLDR